MPVPADSKISSVCDTDIAPVCALAREIWLQHYPGIITVSQIEYMLAQRYNPAVVREELARGDLWWDKLLLNGRMVGFASYFLLRDTGAMKLDKLYVHPAHQRSGYGRMLVDRAVTMARACGCDALVLAVNKHNAAAIAAYVKHGFAIVDSVVKDIGSGFVMDDYVMRLDV